MGYFRVSAEKERFNTTPLGAEWATTWPGSRACPGVLRPFIIPNKKCRKDLRDYSLSVDEIEKITGLDFFIKSRIEMLEADSSAEKWFRDQADCHRSLKG